MVYLTVTNKFTRLHLYLSKLLLLKNWRVEILFENKNRSISINFIIIIIYIIYVMMAQETKVKGRLNSWEVAVNNDKNGSNNNYRRLLCWLLSNRELGTNVTFETSSLKWTVYLHSCYEFLKLLIRIESVFPRTKYSEV